MKIRFRYYFILIFCSSLCAMNPPASESPKKEIQRPRTLLMDFLGPFGFEAEVERILTPCASGPVAHEQALEDTLFLRQTNS